jgi:membrane protein implicated in regulation of membrane protease activity
MLTYAYLALIVICGGFTLVSFVLGAIADFADDVGNSIEGAVHSVSDSVGGLLGGHGDVDLSGAGGHDVAADAGDGVTPSPFSLRTITMFLMGFGGGGLIAKGAGVSDELSLVPATLTGVLMASLMYLFLRYLYGSVGTTMSQPSDYVGLIGRVTVSVPEGGQGTVSLTVKGQTANTACVSADSTAIPFGSEIYVVSYAGGVASVKRLAE